MDTQDDMQRTLRGIESILQNLEGNLERLTPEQATWKLSVTRQQLDNIVFNMRQRYPED